MKNGLQKGMSLSFKVICIAFILFHLYTAYFGVVQGNGQKTIHLGFILLVCYLQDIFNSEKGKIERITAGFPGPGPVQCHLCDRKLSGPPGPQRHCLYH